MEKRKDVSPLKRLTLFDSTLRIGGRDYDKLGKFLTKLNTAVGDREINIVFTVSADKEELPESVQAFIG